MIVRAEIAFTSVRVYLGDVLHLDFRRGAYLGLQAWKYAPVVEAGSDLVVRSGYWAIEIYLTGAAPILAEYEREETWRAVLDALEKLKLSGV
jgi:hypothetical protein